MIRVRAALIALCVAGVIPAQAIDWRTEPGLHTAKLELRGLLNQRRKIQYYVPADLDATEPVPLLIALHGGLSSPRNIRRRSMLNQLADREGLIAVYPQGNGIFGRLLHWNAGLCCGKAAKEGIDDAAFIARTIDQLAAVLPIDTRRVYAFGFSNGAMLSYQLAGRFPNKIAAIAAISGTFGRVTDKGEFDWPFPPPDGGVPTLVIHGDEDPRLPFDGLLEPAGKRGGNGMVPVIDTARFWARANGCTAELEPPSPFDNVTLWSWRDCTTGKPVDLYRLHGWGHRWAGQSPHTKADHTKIGRFESIDVIWSFFRDHRTGDQPTPASPH